MLAESYIGTAATPARGCPTSGRVYVWAIWLSAVSCTTTRLELPPAATTMGLSWLGWKQTCQVSEGAVSMTAMVLSSSRFHTCSPAQALLKWAHTERMQR